MLLLCKVTHCAGHISAMTCYMPVVFLTVHQVTDQAVPAPLLPRLSDTPLHLRTPAQGSVTQCIGSV